MKTRWAPSHSEFFYPRPLGLDPLADLLLIALTSPALRLLRRPAKLVHEASDMIGVVVDVERALDHLGDARRCPEVGGIVQKRGSGEKDLNEFPALVLVQPARPSGRGLSSILCK
jgi:hypothetical protein